ncbi:hypothetical protein AWB64_01266 [Caballeronia sordidicola]|uniref:Uncharacterized protein n=1 Tax=Caballeronia sordidicola TaxID=196367 RepID=A0A158FFG2_CABSO|nr:hypothetical protein AWB64_01266 [Caballeronia sordidicola]
MQTVGYKGFLLYGHSIEQQDGFAASGTVVQDGKLVQSSGVLAVYQSDEDAMDAGVRWAQEWIDFHA